MLQTGPKVLRQQTDFCRALKQCHDVPLKGLILLNGKLDMRTVGCLRDNLRLTAYPVA